MNTLEQKAAIIANAGHRVVKVENEFFIVTEFTPNTIQTKFATLVGKRITNLLNTINADTPHVMVNNIVGKLPDLYKEHHQFHEGIKWYMWLS